MPTGYDQNNQDFYDNAPRATAENLKKWEKYFESSQDNPNPKYFTDDNPVTNTVGKGGREQKIEGNYSPVDHNPYEATKVEHNPFEFSQVPGNPFDSAPGLETPYSIPQGIIGILKNSAKALATLPQRAIEASSNQTLTEDDPTGSKDSTGTALETAGAMFGAGTTFLPSKSLSSMGGLFSSKGRFSTQKGMDDLKLFGEMENSGKFTKEQIYDATKIYRGNDYLLRFEIPDDKAVLNPRFVADKTTILPVEPTPLREILSHPEAYTEYPGLGDFPVRAMTKEDLDRFGPDTRGVVAVNRETGKPYMALKNDSPEAIKSVLLHEGQHVIQDMEGFARGGSSKDFETQRFKELNNQYKTRESRLETELAQAPNAPSLKTVYSALEDYTKKGAGEASTTTINTLNRLTDPQLEEAITMFRVKGIAKEYTNLTLQEYRKLAGEVESRNVQTRDLMRAINKDLNENKLIPKGWESVNNNPHSYEDLRYPWYTEDIKPESQIIKR